MKKRIVMGCLSLLSAALFAQKPQIMQADCRIPIKTDVSYLPAGDVVANQLTMQNRLAFQKWMKKLLKDAMKGKIAVYNPDNPQEKWENAREMLVSICKTEDLDQMVNRLSDYMIANYLYTATGMGNSREVKKEAQRIVLMALSKQEDERDRTVFMFKMEDLSQRKYKIRVRCKRYPIAEFLNKQSYYSYPVQFYDETGTLAVFNLAEAAWLKAMIETGEFKRIEEEFKQFKRE